jgi:hypothetical protein
MNGHTFLDASFWIAYRDPQQEMHGEARRIFPETFRLRTTMITTLPVVCEIQAHFSRNRNWKRLILADLRNNPLIRIEETAQQDQEQAFEILNRHVDKNYSLCDTLSFAVMRRLGLKRALAFDDHFRQFGGFEVIC